MTKDMLPLDGMMVIYHNHSFHTKKWIYGKRFTLYIQHRIQVWREDHMQGRWTLTGFTPYNITEDLQHFGSKIHIMRTFYKWTWLLFIWLKACSSEEMKCPLSQSTPLKWSMTSQIMVLCGKDLRYTKSISLCYHSINLVMGLLIKSYLLWNISYFEISFSCDFQKNILANLECLPVLEKNTISFILHSKYYPIIMSLFCMYETFYCYLPCDIIGLWRPIQCKGSAVCTIQLHKGCYKF